jgi:hypothetical protein
MATSITSIRDKLKDNVRHQRTPTTYTDSNYLDLAISGCKKFYIDIGLESNWDSEYTSGVSPTLSRDLNILETDYCIKASEIAFYKEVRAYWSTMVSYTTNALSVAYAFKPFEFFTSIINECEKELISLFQKMTEYSNMTSVSEITVDPVDYDFE